VEVANAATVKRNLRQDVATERRTLRSRSGRRVGLARLTRRCRACLRFEHPGDCQNCCRERGMAGDEGWWSREVMFRAAVKPSMAAAGERSWFARPGL
jgi:hypothetical protein